MKINRRGFIKVAGSTIGAQALVNSYPFATEIYAQDEKPHDLGTNNKIGIFYAYWCHDWAADFTKYIPRAASLGFDTIELNSSPITEMSDMEKDKIKACAEKVGIEISFCTGLTSDYDIASDDAVTREKGINFLKKKARMMKYMNAKKVSGILYGAWPAHLPQGVSDRRPYIDRSIESMKEAIKTAEDCDVYFNMECLNRFEQYIMNTCQEGLDYVNRVGSNNCKLLLDTFHMNIEEDSFTDAITKAKGKIGHVHIGEANRRPPGTGRLPWDEIFNAIKKVNYTDSIVIESFVQPGGEIGRDISVFRDLTYGQDLDVLAKESLEFVRQKIS